MLLRELANNQHCLNEAKHPKKCRIYGYKLTVKIYSMNLKIASMFDANLGKYLYVTP